MSDVRLNLTGTGFGTLAIDGQDLGSAVTHVELTASAGKPPTLVITVRLDNVLAEGDVRAKVDPVSRLTLRALGWIEPEETA